MSSVTLGVRWFGDVLESCLAKSRKALQECDRNGMQKQGSGSKCDAVRMSRSMNLVEGRVDVCSEGGVCGRQTGEYISGKKETRQVHG